MNHRKWKQMLTLLIILCMVLPTKVVNAATTATSISLSKVEGNSVKVKSGSGKEIKVRKNMNLYSGYGVETGKESYIFLLLDKEKGLKLDQNTRISIKKEGRKNEINLETGELFFDVKKPLESGETMSIRTSNSIMGIRGTSGVVKAKTVKGSNGLYQGRSYTYQIFDGKGYLKFGIGKQETISYDILPGMQAVINEDKEGKATVKVEQIPKSQLSSFAIKEIVNDMQLGVRVEKGLQVDENELMELYKVNTENELDQYAMQEKEAVKQQEIAESNQTVLYRGQQSTTVTETNGSTDMNDAPIVPSESEFPTPTQVLSQPDSEVEVLEPTDEPMNEPTDEPTDEPTNEPTDEPTDEPTNEPTNEPTDEPTDEPTNEPMDEPSDSPIQSDTPYLYKLGVDTEIDLSELDTIFEQYGNTPVEIYTDEVNMEYNLTNELSIPRGCTLILGENVKITTLNQLKNYGTIEIVENAKLKVKGNTYNQGEMKVEGQLVNDDGGDFTNMGTIELVEAKAFQNGTMEDTMPKEPDQYAILVNHGTVKGDITTTNSSYINCWTGTELSIDFQGGIAIGGGIISEGDIVIESEYGMLEFIASDGTYEHQLANSIENLEWSMIDAEYGGDIDIYGDYIEESFVENNLVIQQNSDLPEVVLQSPNGYKYGCSGEKALDILTSYCEYNQMNLNQDFTISDYVSDSNYENQLMFNFGFPFIVDEPVDIPEGEYVDNPDDYPTFIFNLNHNTLDLGKYTIRSEYYLKYKGPEDLGSLSSVIDSIVRLEGEVSQSGEVTQISNSEFDNVILELSGEAQIEGTVVYKDSVLNLQGNLQIGNTESEELILLNPEININGGTMTVGLGTVTFGDKDNPGTAIINHSLKAENNNTPTGIHVEEYGTLRIWSDLEIKISESINQAESVPTVYVTANGKLYLGEENSPITIDAYEGAIVINNNPEEALNRELYYSPTDKGYVINK